jgi:DNA primase
LLLRISSPLLRLQLVKRLAEASGFSQGEVERLCGIRGYAPPAPPQAARHAPSLARAFLRLALQKPELATQVPLAQLPVGMERQLLEAIAVAVTSLPSAPNYAQLREQLRGDAQERALDMLAGELMNLKLNEEDIEKEFQSAVAQLEAAAQKAEFDRLQVSARQFGVSGMSAEEKARYQYLLSVIQKTKS